jgi:hypothetical protein
MKERSRMGLFGDIRKARTCQDLSIRELAGRYGVDRHTVRHALSDPVPPGRKAAKRRPFGAGHPQVYPQNESCACSGLCISWPLLWITPVDRPVSAVDLRFCSSRGCQLGIRLVDKPCDIAPGHRAAAVRPTYGGTIRRMLADRGGARHARGERPGPAVTSEGLSRRVLDNTLRGPS